MELNGGQTNKVFTPATRLCQSNQQRDGLETTILPLACLTAVAVQIHSRRHGINLTLTSVSWSGYNGGTSE